MKYFFLFATLFLFQKIYSQTNGLCFSDPIQYTSDTLAYDIVSGDFNNDNFPDIATANVSADSISVLINSGFGTFLPAVKYKVGLNPWRIISVDLDMDGDLDLVVVNSASETTIGLVSVLLGAGTGAFSASVNYTLSTVPVAISVGDFNHDGKIDIAASGSFDTYFLFGLGNGSFNSAVNHGLGWEGMSSISGDFNSDGFMDLAFIDASTGSNMYVLLAWNMLPQVYYLGGVDCWSMTTGDYNQDGILDIATCSSTDVHVLFGLGWGVFDSDIAYPLNGVQAIGITSSDLNADGNLDLVVTNSGSDDLSVLYGSTNGVFTLLTEVFKTGVGTAPFAVSSSDFNNDGKLDLATANYTTRNVSILLNSIQPNVIIAANTNTLCIGSGVTLQASGAATYTWSTGDFTSVNYQIPAYNSTFIVVGTGINYCSNSQTINITVEATCQDVWPGDANSDGRVDNLDVLELGLHYTQIGAPRTSVSNSWQSYFANNWTGTITNGKNLNHSDCNGDGTIDDNDTLAIFNNYGLTHAFKPVQTNIANPQLSIVPDQSAVIKGNWGTASIYVGDAINGLNNINGLAFTVNFDDNLIESNSVWIEYPISFLNASNYNLHFRKLDFSNGNLYTATTHTNNSNVSGNGKIATLHYQIKSSLTTDELLNIGISQAYQSDASGVINPLTSGTGTIMALASTVGVDELNYGYILLSPNPSSGTLNITSKNLLQKVELMSVDGKVLLSETPTNVSHTLSLQNFANGIYFVNMYQNKGVVKREKIVLNK